MGMTDFGYRHLARPVVFRLGRGDAETAHHRTIGALARIQRHPRLLRALARVFAAHTDPREALGLTFPNPVGLAAGADKDGLALAAWPALGFGFVEAGTVTARAQPGNPTPRVFRLRQSRGVINRMGFPNAGAAALASNCAAIGPLPVPLGISLGKSKTTPIAEATEDYLSSLRAVYDYADYIAVNVSSPNTPGLRGLQDKGALDELITALVREATALSLARQDAAGGGCGADYGGLRGEGRGRRGHGFRSQTDAPTPESRRGGPAPARRDGAPAPARRVGAPVPLLVKIAPDLAEHAIADVLAVCEERGVAGVIATNTTIGRPNIAGGDRGLALEAGGLSGAPLTERALGAVRFVCRSTRLPVIGVGGIMNPDDALRMFDAGAALVQLYTGLLYEGPGLNRRIVRAAANRPDQDPH